MARTLRDGAASVEVLRLPGGRVEDDRVAREEPLEIRLDGIPLAVTMRTPGDDEELALGFCVSEGIPATAARPSADLAANTVEIEAPGFDRAQVQRSFYTSSSCGVCGKGALEAVVLASPRIGSDLRVPFELVAGLPARLREGQPTFAATGGLHAAGLFDADGALVCLREDVGRHNAPSRQAGRLGLPRGAPAAGPERRLPLGPHLLRAGAEGGARGLPPAGRGGGALEPRDRARGRPRADAVRVRARGPRHRLHRAVARPGLTGILLLGGSSSRFGSPKALALLDGVSLAERAWRTLGEACEARLAVGKAADDLELPFPVLDDGSELRASIVGLAAGLRAAPTDLCVVLPVDCPCMTAPGLWLLASACRQVAHPPGGPLPGAYRRSVLAARSRPAIALDSAGRS